MKKKIPTVVQTELRKYQYNNPGNSDMYSKSFKPDKGLDEWLYFNPWTDMSKQINKRVYVKWSYSYGF